MKFSPADWKDFSRSGNFVSWTKKPLYVKFLLQERVMDFIYLETYIVLLASENLQKFLLNTCLVLLRNCSSCPSLCFPTISPEVEIKVV